MGKQRGKKKKQIGDKSGEASSKQLKGEDSPRNYDKDNALFISMSQDLKEEGNKLFQFRDHEGAMLKYEKALKLLPINHIDVSYLRSNMAACYMQMGLSEYPRAIHECNLALEVTPKYSKALLKRARCYEALHRLDLALRDVNTVLNMEPNNIMALEISERVTKALEMKGLKEDDAEIKPLDFVELPSAVPPQRRPKKKNRKKKNNQIDGQKTKEAIDEKKADEIIVGEKKADEIIAGEKKAHEIIVVEKKADEIIVGKKKADEIKVGEKKADEIIVGEKKADEIIVGKKKADEIIVGKKKADEIIVGEKKADEIIVGKKKADEIIVGENKAAEMVEEEKVGDIIVGEKKADEIRVGEKKADEIIVGEKKVDKIIVGEKKADEIIVGEKKADETGEEKKAEDKLVVEEKITRTQEQTPMKTVKLVFGEDIRWAKLPIDCTLLQLREVIRNRFPSSRAVLIKYRDEEGDLVTITTNEELRLAETSIESQGSVRFYIFEVNPEQDPFYERIKNEELAKCKIEQTSMFENGNVLRGKEIMRSSCIDDWIIQFAQLFINHVGFESGSYLDLHELGMKLYSEAMEETVTSEEAQDLFEIAAEKFHEMAALALFYWGNVIMSRARKKVYFTDGASKAPVFEQIKAAYDWVKKEYVEAGKKYQIAVEIKPDFYEGYLALGQQQFEQAKLSWHYAVSSNVDLKTWPCTEVLQLYNNAEDNMETGMKMWEECEEQRASELSKSSNVKTQLQKMGLDGLLKDISADEAAEQAKNMRSHINLLWGTMLYERSILEFKLGLPVWHECLEVAVEKFELAGASATDIAVMIKNHCSSNNAHEGLGFKIDEIVQAWNEMYEARKLLSGVPSFRLEPLFRRRVSRIYHVLEEA